jgi:hypothetical protein
MQPVTKAVAAHLTIAADLGPHGIRAARLLSPGSQAHRDHVAGWQWPRADLGAVFSA